MIYIYDIFISRPLTITCHKKFAEYFSDQVHDINSFLDIGVGTGLPLLKIVHIFKETTEIVGIDIDKNYLHIAQKRFQGTKYNHVTIQELNFYDIQQSQFKGQKFDVVFFSFSFMLMPDQIKALQIAKQILNPDGKIFFLLTLYPKRNKLVESIKPALKKYTSVDFGEVHIESEFCDMLTSQNLYIEKKVRVKTVWNPFLYIFNVFLVECTIAK